MSFSLRSAVLTVTALALLTGCQGGSGVMVHADDEEHPLALLAGSGSFASSAEERVPGGTWTTTFGSIFPCVAKGPSPMTIDGVDWVSDEGQRPLSVQVYSRTFDDSQSDPIISMIGTPPDGNVELSGAIREGVEGFKVEHSCKSVMDGTGQRDEFLVAVKAGERGAHVGDFTVRYTTPDGKKYAVVSDWRMYVCGSEVPEELCDENPET